MAGCPLTPRQLTILRLVAKGLTLDGAATCLQLSPQTVKNQMWKLHGRLGTHSQAEAVYKAVKEGWLQ